MASSNHINLWENSGSNGYRSSKFQKVPARKSAFIPLLLPPSLIHDSFVSTLKGNNPRLKECYQNVYDKSSLRNSLFNLSQLIAHGRLTSHKT